MVMVSARFVEFSAISDIPETAREIMRLSLLDWCGCVIAGYGQPAAQIVCDMVVSERGAGQAWVIGSDIKVPMRAAAMANGVASHCLDFDDTHFAHIGHPSVAVVPAALAVAQHNGVSGADFLDAALVGAETSIRVGVWLGRSHYQAGFHQTATAGAFGATIAAGRLLELNAKQMSNALGVISTRASGLKNQFGSMGKPMNAGIAASNGVEAAHLAKAGFLSCADGIGGDLGFGASHAGAANEAAFDAIGHDWMMQGVSHKFHACCHGLHAMLEALVDILPVEVRSIVVKINPRWQSVCNIQNPKTGLEAKFSYRHVAAMALSGIDTADLSAYSDANANDAALSLMRDKVAVIFEPEISETATQVTVISTDGSTHVAAHDIRASLPLDQRHDKIRAKVKALVGAERADQIWAAIESGPDMVALTATLKT